MNFFNSLFNSSRVECPRCLGKGYVDENDIARLKRELKWVKGKCAYCIGEGNVPSKVTSFVPADIAYLTTDLPDDERQRLFDNDKDAMERAKEYETQTDNFINQVEFLSFIGGLSPENIADFFLIGSTTAMTNANERTDLLDYINRIIAFRKA